ncbi:hypothetical protein C725_0932 [Pacificimonas flava]|uniref:Uncharacterized protein n=1 Tax=Pacificimonas flava TaxID=1234595 RepID=M2SF33_9SPHN|nr:hypothetical protein C725_0932 [Pacificimonas flava]
MNAARDRRRGSRKRIGRKLGQRTLFYKSGMSGWCVGPFVILKILMVHHVAVQASPGFSKANPRKRLGLDGEAVIRLADL